MMKLEKVKEDEKMDPLVHLFYNVQDRFARVIKLSEKEHYTDNKTSLLYFNLSKQLGDQKNPRQYRQE